VGQILARSVRLKISTSLLISCSMSVSWIVSEVLLNADITNNVSIFWDCHTDKPAGY